MLDQELQALHYFQGDFCVQFLRYDQETFEGITILLLEYIQPECTLKDWYLQDKEEESIEIFADLVKKVHQKPLIVEDYQQYDQPQTVAQRLQLLHHFQSNHVRLNQLIEQAVQIVDRLLATQARFYFLHGDLHHENILQNHDRWIMIGFIGELAYEVGAFVRNPIFMLLKHPDIEQLMQYRFHRLSLLLDLDKQGVIAWSFVQCVLAACYSQQDDQDQAVDYFVSCAELIKNFFMKTMFLSLHSILMIYIFHFHLTLTLRYRLP